MGVLWFILKIILFVLLTLLSLIILAVVIILFMPIHYEAYVERYNEFIYDCKFSYLKWVHGHFSLEKGIKNHEIRAFGKILYEYKTKPQEIVEKPQETLENPQEVAKDTNKAIAHTKLNKVKDDKGQSRKESSSYNTEKTSSKVKKKIDTPIIEEAQDTLDDVGDKIEKETKNFVRELNGFQIKELIFDKDFYGLLREIYKVLKSILKYILPRKWSYEVVFGMEDPADTGELLAKLTLLYPIYYKHGIIKGDFERAGIWGGFLANGKFNLFGIIKRMIIFLFKPLVRRYIKLALNIRKEEKNGK